MNCVIKLVFCTLLLILGVAEINLFSTYWSKLLDPANFDKSGPIIQSLFVPLVAAVTVLASYLVINTQFERNRDLERVKQRLGEIYKRESDAYFKTWEAVSTSYRLLSELQKGTLDPSSKTKIDAAFCEAEPNAFVLKIADQDEFYTFWQKITEVIALAANTADGPPKEQLWAAHVHDLSRPYYRIRNDFREQYLDRSS